MDSYKGDIKNIIKVFKGELKGIVLSKRGDNDPHIMFTIISEDDGDWFKEVNNCSSSYWIDDLREQITEASIWLKNEALPDIYEGRQYGYKIKES